MMRRPNHYDYFLLNLKCNFHTSSGSVRHCDVFSCFGACFNTKQQAILVMNVTRVSDVRVTMHRNKFPIIKPTRCTNFLILFWNETACKQDQDKTSVPS